MRLRWLIHFDHTTVEFTLSLLVESIQWMLTTVFLLLVMGLKTTYHIGSSRIHGALTEGTMATLRWRWQEHVWFFFFLLGFCSLPLSSVISFHLCLSPPGLPQTHICVFRRFKATTVFLLLLVLHRNNNLSKRWFFRFRKLQ